MKRWTRLLAILLALGMLLSLSACGSKDADKIVRELVDKDADAILLKDYASPLEFYRAVEQRRVDEYKGLLLGSPLLQNAQARDVFLQTELMVLLDQSVLEQELIDLLTESAGMDLSWIRNLSLNLISGSSGKLSQANAVLRLNDTDIIHMDVVMDTETMTEYLAVPELNESYAAVKLAELLEDSGVDADEMLNMLSGSAAQNTIGRFDLLLRYYRLMLENITKLELNEGTVSAGGVSCDCSIAKITIEGEDVRRIANAVLDEAAQDKDVEALVYQSFKLAGEFRGSEEDFHARYQSLIQMARDEVADIGDDGSILMTVYIDAKGEILGRNVEVLSEGERVALFSFLTARDGDKLGVEAQFGSFNKYETWESQNVVKLSGSGTYSSDTGKITGNYLVSYYELEDYRGERTEKDMELFNASVDVTLGKTGLLGEILLTPSDDLLNMILEELYGAPESVTRLVRSLTLAIVNRNDNGKFYSVVVIRSNGQDLLSLSLSQSPTDKFAITVPTDAVDMDTWSSSIGFGAISTIMNNLRSAGVPASLFNSLIG